MLRTRARRAARGRHRRRAARPRGGARPAQPRARRPRRPPDAAPDGRAARSRRRPPSCSGSSSRWGCASLTGTGDDGGARATVASTGVAFRDGSTLDCDMVVVAAGIRPNVELAQPAGLAVERGIVVGDDLACPGADGCLRDRRVRRASRSGLRPRRAALGTGAGPGRSADAPRPHARLRGLAALDEAQGRRRRRRRDGREGRRRRRRRGRQLRGAVARHLQEADRPQRPAGRRDPHRRRPLVPGARAGVCRGDAVGGAPRGAALPAADRRAAARARSRCADDAQICDCNAVSKAQIVDAVLRGASSLQAVCERTRAGTGCGSCRPEVQRIVELACCSVGRARTAGARRPPRDPADADRAPEDGREGASSR